MNKKELNTAEDEVLLDVRNLKQYFPVERNFFGKPTRYLKAVDGVSFTIKKGHTFGLVGESGCGKTTLGRTIISLYNATDGEAFYEGRNILNYDKKEKQRMEKLGEANIREALYMEWLISKANLDSEVLDVLEKDDLEISKYFLDAETKKKFTNNEYLSRVVPAYLSFIVFWKTKENIANLKFVNSLKQMEFEDAYQAYSTARKINVGKKTKEVIIAYLEEKSSTTLEEREEKKAEINSVEHVEKCVNFMSKQEKRSLKTEVQMIFQDPYSSLSPRMCVGEIISEAVKEHKLVPDSELKDYTFKIMKECGLQPYYYQRYPHEFSGGQRQRIGIARSLALNPKLVICDEPVSALDVSIQAQIINLLKDLQKEKGLSYLFISHDLSVVEHISDDVGVMYLGNMVEVGSKDQIFNNTCHPYTQSLFSAIPMPDPDYKKDRIKLKGELPSPINPPKGCKFHTRCSKCMECCKTVNPKNIEVEKGHFVKCHLFDKEMMAKVKQN